MAQTSTYKQLSHLPRYLTQESALNGGVIFTDNTIDEGAFHMIANAEYDDVKACLTSRKGLQTVESIVLEEASGDRRYHILGDYPIVVWDLELGPVRGGVQYYTRKKDIYTNCILCAPLNAEGDAYAADYLKVLVKDKDSESYTAAVPRYFSDTPQDLVMTESDAATEGFIKKRPNAAAPVATFFQNTLYLTGLDANTKAPQLKKIQMCKYNNKYLFCLSTSSTPYDVSASEAVSSGYNMLKGKTAYTFSNSVADVWKIDGIIPKDEHGNILLTLNQNQTVFFHLVYKYPSSTKDVDYCFKWEWAAADTASDKTKWEPIYNGNDGVINAKPGASTPIKIEFGAPVSNCIIRVTVYPANDPEDVKAVGMTTLSRILETKTRAEYITYDLTTAAGMTGWEGRLVLWGVDGADNILFASDINNASYFPYPNNVHIFDKPIVQVVNYMDGLLVFTTERIYLLKLASDGMGFTVNAVQNRLSFHPDDAQYIQVIKNMVFFKTDNYFYMIVPKATSLTGELTVAPIYKAMASFFNDPKKALEKDIVKEVYVKPLVEANAYNKQCLTYEGLQYNYVDQNTIRTVYGVRVDLNGVERHLAVVLNYDTVTRVWTFHTYETNGRPTVAQYQLSTSEAPLLNVYHEGGNECLQILKYTNNAYTDDFKLDERAERIFKNILLIDTGYHDMAGYANFKKRFREIQFNVFPLGDDLLEFGTAFLLDGCTRKDYKVYSSIAEDGVIYLGKMDVGSDAFVYNGRTLSCTLTEDMTVPYDVTVTELLTNVDDVSARMSDCTTLGAWRIGLSTLREPTAITFRQPVSGKGLLPRFKLLGFREQAVELNGISWVYHLMNGR